MALKVLEGELEDVVRAAYLRRRPKLSGLAMAQFGLYKRSVGDELECAIVVSNRVVTGEPSCGDLRSCFVVLNCLRRIPGGPPVVGQLDRALFAFRQILKVLGDAPV